MSTDSQMEEALRLMQMAMNTLGPTEREAVAEIRREVDAAASGAGGEAFDKRLEFCYAIKFSKDKIKNGRLQQAAEAYIKAAEGG